MVDAGQQRQRVLIIALLASLLLWNLSWGVYVLYPFKLLATWMHEMSHGVLMLATGSGLAHLQIFPDTSGIAQAKSGVGPFGSALIHSAGYMGTAIMGSVLLVIGQTRSGARSILALLAVALGVSSFFWINNSFGQTCAYVGAAVGCAIALIPSQRIAVIVVNFIAAQSCVNALLDIRVLFRPNTIINGQVAGISDAHAMAGATFGNHWFWAGLWLVWSCLCFYAALRIIYLRQERPMALEEVTDHCPKTAVVSDA